MARLELTDKFVASIKADPSGKRIDIFDLRTPGLELRISAKGKKTWSLRKRVGDKIIRRTISPPYPATSLKSAREQARAFLVEVELAGGIPARMGATTVLARDMTVKAAVTLYDERELTHQKRGKKVKAALDRELVARFGTARLADIRLGDLITIQDAMTDRGVTTNTNRVVSMIKTFFTWAGSRDMIQSNPASALEKKATEATRERVLTDRELALVWKAAGIRGYPYAQIVQLLILTGQRLSEVTGMVWDELNLDTDKPQWLLPATRTKNTAANNIHLSPLALAIVRSVPAIKDQPLLFSTTGKTPVSGHSKAKDRIDSTIIGLVDGDKLLIPPPWTFHDLRRTFATGSAALGTAPHIIETMINHKSGVFKGVAGIYNRHDYAPECKAAFDLWAKHIESLTK